MTCSSGETLPRLASERGLPPASVQDDPPEKKEANSPECDVSSLRHLGQDTTGWRSVLESSPRLTGFSPQVILWPNHSNRTEPPVNQIELISIINRVFGTISRV